MYLHSFCDNFESKVLDYMNNNQITPTDCSKNLKDSTYYHSVESFSHSPDQSFSNFYVMSDPIQFIQSFFKLNDKVIHEIKDIVSLVGKFFKIGKKKASTFSNNHSFIISKQTDTAITNSNSVPNFSISFLFLKTDLIFKLNDKNELVFVDLTGFIKKEYIPIDDNDVSKSFSTAVEFFRQDLFKVSGMSNVGFNHNSIEDNYEINKNFTCQTRYFFLEELKLLKDKHPSSGVVLSPDGMIFNSNDMPLFLHSMKTIFSRPVYLNIEKAMNFYHAYNLLMNNNYCIEVVMLNNIDSIMSISFDNIIFDVALKNKQLTTNYSNKKERTTLFEIYTKKPNNDNKLKTIKTNDLFELYEYIFGKYSKRLSKILEKEVYQMTMDDAKVLLMYNC